MIKKIYNFIKPKKDFILNYLIIQFFVFFYKKYTLYKIVIFVQILLSYFLIYILQSLWIKNIFNDSTPREFLSMGDHAKKGDTPYFGGLVFFLSLFPLFIFSFKEPKGWLIFFSSLISGTVGFFDDYFKKKYKKGLSAKVKFILQGSGSLFSIFIWSLLDPNFSTDLIIGNFSLNLGYFYFFWATMVIISTSHAVNLTDGIDGLAASQTILILLNLIFFISNINPFFEPLKWFSLYLLIPLLIFLGENLNPANIFMSDVGSLFLGAYLASLFLIFKIEMLLIISGVVFVIETLSVIIQVLSFKIRKKRLFLFAPIHHDLEKRGFSENKIVLFFLIISFFFQIIFFYLIK